MDEIDSADPEGEDDLTGTVDAGGDAVLLCPTMYGYEPWMFASLFECCRKYGLGRLYFADPVVKTCIWKARDRMAHIFLHEYTAPYALFCDHDQGLPTGNVPRWRKRFRTTLPDRFGAVNAVERILGHPPQYGIVGGVYMDRRVGGEIMCKDGCGPRRNIQFIDGVKNGIIRGLVKQDWVATGFLRIHRRVFEKMAKNMDQFPEIRPAKKDGRIGFFHPWIEGGHSEIGEDVAFNLRAKKLGEQPMLDCDLRIFHQGTIWR